jgi:transposase
MPGSRPPGKQARRWDGPKRVFDRSSVHALRAQGLSIREIATRLDVGMGTVTRTLAETLAEAA